MDGIRLGSCMIWKPGGGGVKALVTVVALDLDKDRAQVHVRRATTGTCAPHWVDMAALAPAPAEAVPCACMRDHQEPGKDPHAA